MAILLTQLLQGAAGFLLLWFLFRRTIVERQSKVASYEVLARDSRRYAIRSPPYFNWPCGLMYSTFFFFSLPLLIWRYGTYRALGLALVPLLVATGMTYVIDISPFLLLLLARSFIGLTVASNDSKYRERTMLKRGWMKIGTYGSASRSQAIRDSRLSQP